MIIRRATLADLDGIMGELSRHIAACKVHYPAPQREAVAQTLLSAFHHTAPVVVLVAEHAGRVIGLACVVASRYLWAPAIQAEIRLVYVAPEHRGGTAFARLMDGVQEWAKEKCAAELSFTMSTGVDDEATADCLEKRGWKRAGVDLVKAVCSQVI